MKWRTEEIPLPALLLITGLAVLALIVGENSVTPVRQPFYQQKVRAAKVMLLAMNAIKTEKASMGFTIDLVNDPTATGMIGPEYTLVTTDRGDLSAKLLTVNPNFAAVIVDMLGKAKLKKADPVAVAMTGSFPALNIAVLAALESMDLKPLVITSVGSSSWGANDPQMCWLDMERVLRQKGLIKAKSLAASIGGGKDAGRGLSPEGRTQLTEAIKRNQIPLIAEDLLENNIRERIETYDKGAGSRNVRAYINIGGGVASLGNSVNGDLFPAGLSINTGLRNFPTKGTMILMAERGIPIIHLLNISEIAKRYRLPAEPTQEDFGQGDVYFKEHYNRTRVLLITLGLIALTIGLVRLNVSHYLAFLRQVRLRGINTGTAVLPPMEMEPAEEKDKSPI